MKNISFLGWKNCIHLSNGTIEMVVTADVGPRIIHFGFVSDGINNEANLFGTLPDQLGRIGDSEWNNYGGHRFWLAPENKSTSYYPDNNPVTVEDHGNFVRIIAPIETTTRIQKIVDIAMHPSLAKVSLNHRAENHNPWAVELAPWALTVMAPGGTAVFPLPAQASHDKNLLPTSTLSLWGYTQMADPRWHWGNKYILLRQDPSMTTPQKVGGHNTAGWLGYIHNGRFFVKRFTSHNPESTYPDLNSSAELYTDAHILELESLAPLVQLAPGATMSHRETWQLFNDVPTPQNDEDVVKHLLPKL